MITDQNYQSDPGHESQGTHQHAGPAGDCIFCRLGPAVNEFLNRIGPPESARQHFRQARVEMLRGMRAILDERIESLTREEQRGTKVVVE